ncbi:MAG: DUF805 domain-containing protein [Chloroflexi bacterium]|nr:DUF805 domain-containing protein [Chloroflexota bacterium]
MPGTASPGGRVNRRAFIGYSIAAVLLTPVVSIALVLLSIALAFGQAALLAFVAILVGIGIWCGGFLVLLVLTIGRLRDMGLSGWSAALPAGVFATLAYVMLTLEFEDAIWWVLTLSPLAWLVLTLPGAFMPGQAGPNKYDRALGERPE